MSSENEARTFLRKVLPMAIDGIINEDSTPAQQERFADAIVRAIAMLIEAKCDSRDSAGDGNGTDKAP